MTGFENHPGFRRLFAPDELTVGLFLPLWPFDGEFRHMAGQGGAVVAADRGGFAALWLRDVPLQTAPAADVGQVYDPWTYAAWLAARTERVALATGSAIVTLRHPLDVAKQAASIDRLSGGRLVLGVASGDRPVEFPAYGIDYTARAERFRAAVGDLRGLFETGRVPGLRAAGPDPVLLPRPAFGRVPLIVTGAAGQSPDWIAEHADGWLTYPGPTATAQGPAALGAKIAALRALVPDGGFLPAATNEWVDLEEDPRATPVPLDGGRVLRTGTDGLLELLERWRANGVNHGALGIQHGRRPAAEVVEQLVAEVIPHFPAHKAAPEPAPPVW